MTFSRTYYCIPCAKMGNKCESDDREELKLHVRNVHRNERPVTAIGIRSEIEH